MWFYTSYKIDDTASIVIKKGFHQYYRSKSGKTFSTYNNLCKTSHIKYKRGVRKMKKLMTRQIAYWIIGLLKMNK